MECLSQIYLSGPGLYVAMIFQKLYDPVTGLYVRWDGYYNLIVGLPIRHKNTLCGLCGNFDDNRRNDWKVGPQSSCFSTASNPPTTLVSIYYSHNQVSRVNVR